MPFERPRPFWRTLRFRLMIWNAGAVVLTAVLTLLLVREGVRHSLLEELDERLHEDILEIALAIEEPKHPDFGHLYQELDWKARGHVRHGWFVRLFDSGGRMIWASDTAPPLSAAMEEVQDFQPLTTGGSRVVQHRTKQRDGAAITVRVGASLSFLDAAMTHIDRLVMLVGVCVLLVSPLGGYLLAGRATRPLQEINSTTARLRPSRLDERLPVRGTRDEIDQLSHTINGFLDRIAAYINQRRDFLANAAHELRTPLAAVRSSVEVALGGDRSPHEYEELLSEVIDECSSLEVLVNQLLLLAETDAERSGPAGQRVALDELVRRSAEMFRGAAEARNIDLRVDPLSAATVEGQPRHLRQVLNNLFDNALKFTPERGRILVSLTTDELQGIARLRVTDSGIGIAPADLPHVFERFYRADKSRTREGETRGTGLGLSICRAIIQAHGGTIGVESTPNRGSTFTVTLPLFGSPSQGSAHEEAATASAVNADPAGLVPAK